MVFETFFGSSLLKGKEKVPVSILEGKIVGIYFSAHWCPPCRGFTPQLVQFYQKLKEKRQDFEFVFVSSDRDQTAFDEYYHEMPWLGLPYEDRDRKGELSRQYKVQGIPTFILLDKDGNLITSKAREMVSRDSEGLEFPWIPKTLEQILGNSFIDNHKNKVEMNLKGKIFGLYFSAHWCPPCRSFTPVFAEEYKKLKSEGKDFEIIFLSSDRSEAEFNEYLEEMPWKAIPFSDNRTATLSDVFDIEGIPSLLFFDEKMNLITSDGVEAISEKNEFPYYPKPLNHLSGPKASSLNENPCVIVFSKNPFFDALYPLAKEYVDAKKGVHFFIAGDDPFVARIREFANLGEAEDLLVLLDVPSQKKYLAPTQEITVGAVKSFVDDFLAKKLTAKGIKE